MIEKYTTKLSDRITRRLMDTDGTIKNGYILILGFLIGLLIGASL